MSKIGRKLTQPLVAVLQTIQHVIESAGQVGDFRRCLCDIETLIEMGRGNTARCSGDPAQRRQSAPHYNKTEQGHGRHAGTQRDQQLGSIILQYRHPLWAFARQHHQHSGAGLIRSEMSPRYQYTPMTTLFHAPIMYRCCSRHPRLGDGFRQRQTRYLSNACRHLVTLVQNAQTKTFAANSHIMETVRIGTDSRRIRHFR